MKQIESRVRKLENEAQEDFVEDWTLDHFYGEDIPVKLIPRKEFERRAALGLSHFYDEQERKGST